MTLPHHGKRNTNSNNTKESQQNARRCPIPDIGRTTGGRRSTKLVDSQQWPPLLQLRLRPGVDGISALSFTPLQLPLHFLFDLLQWRLLSIRCSRWLAPSSRTKPRIYLYICQFNAPQLKEVDNLAGWSSFAFQPKYKN
jgi:hypothetical protein